MAEPVSPGAINYASSVSLVKDSQAKRKRANVQDQHKEPKNVGIKTCIVFQGSYFRDIEVSK